MSNYSQIINRDVENINGEDSFEGMSKENREFFKRALAEAMDLKIKNIEKESGDIEMSLPSRRHKIRMNRLFRERVGGSFLPFPEVDNLYERGRSKLLIKLKIDEFLYRREDNNRKIKN